MEGNISYEPWNYEGQYRQKQILKEAGDYFLLRHLSNKGTSPKRKLIQSAVYPANLDEKDLPGILQPQM